MNALHRAAPAEVVIPLRMVSGRVAPATHVRSTLIASSVQTLRARGYFDEYVAKLPAELHNTVLQAVAGAWMPISVGMAHYAAADALGLSANDQLMNGREVANRVQNSMLATLVRAAKTMGVTPWTGLENFQRLSDRVLMGGGVAVYRVGPKEARIEAHGIPLVRHAYFRNSWRGMVAGSGELFCARVYVTEVASPLPPGAQTPFVMRVAWA